MREMFKDIPGYKGVYQISNLGKVKSLKFGKERILKPGLTYNGYLQVGLSLNNKQESYGVAVLVAIVFLGHSPCAHRIVVDHINNNKQDNRPSNLQLISHRDNIIKNIKGRSQYIGVYWNKTLNKWASQIYMNGEQRNLGSFNSELEASIVYQRELKKYHGAFYDEDRILR